MVCMHFERWHSQADLLLLEESILAISQLDELTTWGPLAWKTVVIPWSFLQKRIKKKIQYINIFIYLSIFIFKIPKEKSWNEHGDQNLWDRVKLKLVNDCLMTLKWLSSKSWTTLKRISWITVELLLTDSWMILEWLLNDSWMTLEWFLHDSCMTLEWLLNDSGMTLNDSWMTLNDSWMTLEWLLNDSWMTLNDSWMTVGWLSDD